MPEFDDFFTGVSAIRKKLTTSISLTHACLNTRTARKWKENYYSTIMKIAMHFVVFDPVVEELRGMIITTQLSHYGIHLRIYIIVYIRTLTLLAVVFVTRGDVNKILCLTRFLFFIHKSFNGLYISGLQL